MIFEPRIFIGSIVFFAALYFAHDRELLFTVPGYMSTVVPLAFLSALLGKRILRRAIRIFVPFLLVFVIPVLLSLIDNHVNAAIFITIGSILYYLAFLSLYRLKNLPSDQTAQALLHATLMSASFFFFASLIGLYLNFTLAVALLMLVVAGVMSAITFVSFLTVSREDKDRNILYSLLVGVLMAELFFVASFWPFGYLTTGSILMSVYFLFWEIALDAFRNTLSLRKALTRVLTVVFIVTVVLWSSPWHILV
jgi:hypothetical protein